MKTDRPTAAEILVAMMEFFRHHSPVYPDAMFDDERTFKTVVREWLDYATKK